MIIKIIVTIIKIMTTIITLWFYLNDCRHDQHLIDVMLCSLSIWLFSIQRLRRNISFLFFLHQSHILNLKGTIKQGAGLGEIVLELISTILKLIGSLFHETNKPFQQSKCEGKAMTTYRNGLFVWHIVVVVLPKSVHFYQGCTFRKVMLYFGNQGHLVPYKRDLPPKRSWSLS